MSGFPLLALLEVSLGVSVLIVLLLLFKKQIRKICASRWMVLVWLVLALRLLIPYHFSLPQAPVTLPMTQRAPVSDSVPAFSVPDNVSGAERQAYDRKAALVEQERKRDDFSPDRVLPFVWGFGVLSVVLTQGVCYGLFRRRLSRSGTKITTGPMWEAFRSECSAQRTSAQLLLCPDVPGPMVTGFFRPALVVPTGDYDSRELEMVFRHELSHLKSRHLWIKLILFLACAVHWFNPLIWWMAREADRDMELACDDEVVRGRDPEFREAYGRTILSLIHRGRLRTNFSTCMRGNKQDLKRRFENILNTGVRRRGAALLCAVLILGVSCGSFLVWKQSSPVQTAQSLWQKRTEYVGDNSAVGALLSDLPLPQGVRQEEFSLQTSKKPYVLTVRYTAESALASSDMAWEYRNAMLLFSLISNADQVTFRVDGYDYGSSFRYTRDLAFRQQLCDLRYFSQNGSRFEQFLSNLNRLHAADFNVLNGKPIRTLTEAQAKAEAGVRQGEFMAISNDLQSRGERRIAGVNCLQFDSDSERSGNFQREMALSEDGCVFFLRSGLVCGQQPPSFDTKKEGLPMYTHKTQDPIEGAVYRAMAQIASTPHDPGNVEICAPIVYGSFAENGEMTVFVTMRTTEYKLDGDTLVPQGGGDFPQALVFSLHDGKPDRLLRFTGAKDGSYFSPSIREFCGSHQDVAEKMIGEYGTKAARTLQNLMEQNVKDYVGQCGLAVKYYQTYDRQKHPVG